MDVAINPSILTSLNTLRGRILTERNQLISFKDQRKNLLDQVAKSGENIELYEKSLSALSIMVDQLSQGGIGVLQQLLTDGLHIIFPDRDYSVKVDIVDGRNHKNMNFLLIEYINGKEIISDIRDSTGGSIKTVVSLICRIYYIWQKKAEPILFMDEPFSNLDQQYFDNIFQLLRIFKEKMGFNFYINSHLDSIISYADNLYTIVDGRIKKIDTKEIPHV